MSDRAKKILFYAVGCPLWFLFSLTCGAYWTFPYDRVRDFIVQEAERNGRTQLDITRLEPSWVTGVEAEGVRVSTVPEDPEERPAELVVREATARISLLSLMAGDTSVDFDAELDGGGNVEGTYTESEEAVHLEATLAAIDLRRAGMLREAIGLPVAGRVDGQIDMTVANEAAGTSGEAQLTIRNLSVADGETPIEIEGFGGLTLARLNLGTLTFRMETERGTGNVEELHADGEHAELWGTGSIRLARPFARSSIDMLVRIQFKDAYRESNDRMAAIFGLLEGNPQVRPARTSDGALQWRIQGSFGGRIRMVPSGRVPMPDAD